MSLRTAILASLTLSIIAFLCVKVPWFLEGFLIGVLYSMLRS